MISPENYEIVKASVPLITLILVIINLFRKRNMFTEFDFIPLGLTLFFSAIIIYLHVEGAHPGTEIFGMAISFIVLCLVASVEIARISGVRIR